MKVLIIKLFQKIKSALPDSKVRQRLKYIENSTREIEWAHVFESTIKGSSWLTNVALSPGRWAVGYSFLYILYRVLNENKFESILEFGVGQSTKLTTSYIRTNNCKLKIIDHSNEWVDFFKKNYSQFDNQNISICSLEKVEILNMETYRYKNLDQIVQNTKFDLIIIDGPCGGDKLSRTDVYELIPNNICKSFIIIIDDYERAGEKRMVAGLFKLLNDNNIKFVQREYYSLKNQMIICSEDYQFYCSL